MSGLERPRYGESLLNRKLGRRSFNAAVVETALSLGLITAVGGGIGAVALMKDGSSQKRYDEIVSDEVKDLEVYTWDTPPVLRKDLSLSEKSEIGRPNIGTRVEVMEILGPVYPTGQSDLIFEDKGERYGIWYRLIKPIKVTKNNGEIVETVGYIAGNFLRKPISEGLEQVK